MESDNILAEANQRENFNLKFSKNATVGEDIRYQRIPLEKTTSGIREFCQKKDLTKKMKPAAKTKTWVRCSRCVQRGISLQWTSSS